MADITFDCPECASPLEVDEAGAGKSVACPQCSKKIQIPSGAPVPAPQSVPVQQYKPCKFCGEQIMATAIKCKHCGEFLQGAQSLTNRAPVTQKEEAIVKTTEALKSIGKVVDTVARSQAGKAGQFLTNLSQTKKSSAHNPARGTTVARPSQSIVTGVENNTPVGYGAIVGSILLGISVPMKWEIIYAGGESMHMTGWIILFDAIGLLGAAVMQRKATTEQEAKKLSKPVMTCAGFAFLYAGYTILTNWSIGDQSFAGMSAGIRNGPGVWLGLVGGIVALASQARFMPKHNTITPEGK